MDPTKYSGQFTYDSKGRATDVWKLQSTATTPWTYTQTHTVYGADADGSWGQANQVTEDYGGANRTTTNNHYTSWGKADQVTDGAGRQFTTNYDLDGQIQSVYQGSNLVASYSYGNTPGTITYGQPIAVFDALSGVNQQMGYVTSGTGIGQVATVTETDPGNVVSTANYTYHPVHGQRQTATLTTPNDTTKWRYGDYQVLGNNTQPSFVPQTIRQLDPATGNPTSEEFHYSYDNVGRLVEVAFAQSPNPGMTQANANATGSFYDTSSNLPVSRARAEYLYDSGGRISSVANYWDTLSGTSYSSTMINGNLCGYEVGTGLNRGLKTSSQYYLGNTLQRTETYGYDADRDYLTSANYGDGLANANVSWTYDAAGNRASDSANPGTWSYDNLNRIVSSPMGSYTHDTLGNRLTGPAGASMTWDVIGRMTGFNNGTDATSYLYRADGLRVAKTGSAGTSRYFYDGQMSTETSELVGAVTTVTQNAVGGRGIERIAKTVGNGSTSYAYPMYDSHGNMIATLSRSGTGYSVAGQRSYDAWGGIRSGAGADEGYCASLGHKLDSESGLTYMRARYYEASTGRFVSEDRQNDGPNWYTYCVNSPTNLRDESGNNSITDHSLYNYLFLAGMVTVLVAVTYASVPCKDASETLRRITTTTSILAVAVAIFAIGLGFGTDAPLEYKIRHAVQGVGDAILRALTAMATSLEATKLAQWSLARAAIVATTAHCIELFGALLLTQEEV